MLAFIEAYFCNKQLIDLNKCCDLATITSIKVRSILFINKNKEFS